MYTFGNVSGEFFFSRDEDFPNAYSLFVFDETQGSKSRKKVGMITRRITIVSPYQTLKKGSSN